MFLSSRRFALRAAAPATPPVSPRSLDSPICTPALCHGHEADGNSEGPVPETQENVTHIIIGNLKFFPMGTKVLGRGSGGEICTLIEKKNLRRLLWVMIEAGLTKKIILSHVEANPRPKAKPDPKPAAPTAKPKPKPKPKADRKPAAPKATAKSKVAPEPPMGGGQRKRPRGV
eukprot:jgi/Tetstr1/442543/TSEL_030641.t1